MSDRMDGEQPGAAAAGNARERREAHRYGEQVRLNREQQREIDLLRSRLREAEDAGFKARGKAIEAEIEQAEADARRSFADGDPEGHIKSVRRVASLEAERAVHSAAPRVAHGANGASSAPPPEFTKRTQEWLDQNPWFFTDPEKGAAGRAAHGAAVAKGLEPDSDGYWGFIETTMEAKFPGLVRRPDGSLVSGEESDAGSGSGADHAGGRQQAQADAGAAAAAGRQAAASGAAPVGRPSGGKPGGETRLSPEEVEIAKSIGVTPESYLANKLSMQKSGELAPAGRR